MHCEYVILAVRSESYKRSVGVFKEPWRQGLCFQCKIQRPQRGPIRFAGKAPARGAAHHTRVCVYVGVCVCAGACACACVCVCVWAGVRMCGW